MSDRQVTGTMLCVLDYYGTDEATFIIQEKLDLDKIVHHTDFSYAWHIYDGNEDEAFDFIAQMHVIEVKKRRIKFIAERS